MAALKTYTEVRTLVKQEMEQIKKRDGEYPKTAYLVVEIADRLKTISPWEGYNHGIRLGMNLRMIVEDLIAGKPNYEAQAKREGNVVPLSKDPYDNLEDALGDKRKTSRSVDMLPSSTAKRQKLKKNLRQAI